MSKKPKTRYSSALSSTAAIYIKTYIKYIYIGYLRIGSGYYGYISTGNDDNNCFVMEKLVLWSIGIETVAIKRNKMLYYGLCQKEQNVMAVQKEVAAMVI
eukprot:456971_1